MPSTKASGAAKTAAPTAREITLPTWAKFRAYLEPYVKQPLSRSQQVLFRGESNARWALKSTLDRHRRFKSSSDRNAFFAQLMAQFKREATGLMPEASMINDEAWLLLARHHGLPTPILDWTQSPYVAAYFAMDGCKRPRDAAVWIFDRLIFAASAIPAISIIEDSASIAFNRRAQEQGSVFMQVHDIDSRVEEYLAAGLTKLVLPAAERALALRDLDAMTINRRALFRDLDGAAQTAAWRLSE